MSFWNAVLTSNFLYIWYGSFFRFRYRSQIKTAAAVSAYSANEKVKRGNIIQRGSRMRTRYLDALLSTIMMMMVMTIYVFDGNGIIAISSTAVVWSSNVRKCFELLCSSSSWRWRHDDGFNRRRFVCCYTSLIKCVSLFLASSHTLPSARNEMRCVEGRKRVYALFFLHRALIKLMRVRKSYICFNICDTKQSMCSNTANKWIPCFCCYCCCTPFHCWCWYVLFLCSAFNHLFVADSRFVLSSNILHTHILLRIVFEAVYAFSPVPALVMQWVQVPSNVITILLHRCPKK